jgi:hypothetical protein
LVRERFGDEKWREILETAGFGWPHFFFSRQDIPDEDVYKVFEATCDVLEITLQEAADAFGDYWVNSFAPRVYPAFFVPADSAKEFINSLSEIHALVTQSIPDARPPAFDFAWENDWTLTMTYKSHRPLIDFAVAMIRGVGKHFGETLDVSNLGDNRISVVFRSQRAHDA